MKHGAQKQGLSFTVLLNVSVSFQSISPSLPNAV